jgi:hypothetical protein
LQPTKKIYINNPGRLYFKTTPQQQQEGGRRNMCPILIAKFQISATKG